MNSKKKIVTRVVCTEMKLVSFPATYSKQLATVSDAPVLHSHPRLGQHVILLRVESSLYVACCVPFAFFVVCVVRWCPVCLPVRIVEARSLGRREPTCRIRRSLPPCESWLKSKHPEGGRCTVPECRPKHRWTPFCWQHQSLPWSWPTNVALTSPISTKASNSPARKREEKRVYNAVC
jgi:hypothetical protein